MPYTYYLHVFGNVNEILPSLKSIFDTVNDWTREAGFREQLVLRSQLFAGVLTSPTVDFTEEQLEQIRQLAIQTYAEEFPAADIAVEIERIN